MWPDEKGPGDDELIGVRTGMAIGGAIRGGNSFMNDKVMKTLNTRSRSDRLKHERSIIENTPGPLNRASWAGENKPFYEW